MNVLIKEQMKLFEPNISEEEYNIRFDNFKKIYFRQHEKYEKRFLNRLSIEKHKKMHKILLQVYKLVNRLNGLSYEIINDQHIATSQPVIFSVTHIGKFDIQVVSEAIKEFSFILTSDFEHLQGTLDGFFLSLNGVIYFNSKVKTDRKAVVEKMITHLKYGGNIMYFPEGAWNLSPNLLVMPCYWGIIDVARKGGAIIVPIACEQYGKHFKINIGKNFDVNNYRDTDNGKLAAITDLRDDMATLKYEIFQSNNMTNRKKLSCDYWDEYLTERFNEWPYIKKNIIQNFSDIESDSKSIHNAYLEYNIRYIDDLTFKPKNVINYDAAFSHLNKIIPTPKNAFLFNKRLK